MTRIQHFINKNIIKNGTDVSTQSTKVKIQVSITLTLHSYSTMTMTKVTRDNIVYTLW